MPHNGSQTIAQLKREIQSYRAGLFAADVTGSNTVWNGYTGIDYKKAEAKMLKLMKKLPDGHNLTITSEDFENYV